MAENIKSIRDEHGGIDAWKSLIGYVKNQIMCLPKGSSFPDYMILRLDGFSKGKYISNNNVEQEACYQYKDMHEAFKVAKKELDKRRDITDGKERLDYALAIVESKVNDIVLARRRKEKQIEAIERLDMSHLQHEGLRYEDRKIKEPERKPNPILDSLW